MSSITVKNIQYKGWKEAIEISNSDIQLIVVPEVGRILHYSLIDGENIFYENSDFKGNLFKNGTFYNNKTEAPNVGGNRVLPCSEDYFHEISGYRHIPDPFINASSYSTSYLTNGVILKSPVSDFLGIQIERKITVNEIGSNVSIHQKLTKVKSAKNTVLSKIPLTIWSLSKIKTPNTAYVKLANKSIFKIGYTISKWPDAKNHAAKNISVKNGILKLKSSNKLPQKIGADAKQWVAGYLENHLFKESFTFDENSKYPDFGTSITIFGNDLFSELEVLSPEKHLELGECIEYQLQWNLYKVPTNKEAEEYLHQSL